MVRHNRGDHLYKWLKEAEQSKAYPLMQAIQQAERVRNRRLCIEIDDQSVLTSRGFRFSSYMTRSPIIFLCGPDPTVMKITKRRIRKYINPYVRHEETERDIQVVLELPDVNRRLLYMGVDEWPMHRKVLWGTMTVATLGAAAVLSMAHYYAHEEDYALKAESRALIAFGVSENGNANSNGFGNGVWHYRFDGDALFGWHGAQQILRASAAGAGVLPTRCRRSDLA